MRIKKIFAATLALCLMLNCALGALAADDIVSEMLKYYLGLSDENGNPVEPDEAQEGEPADFVIGEPAPELSGEDDDEVYVVDEDEEEIVADEIIAVEDLSIKEGLSDEWNNILLLGTDSRTTARYSRTDTMIIMSINPASGEAKLTSIMRDTWVQIPGHGGAKLNAACVYGGPEMTVRCINENFGMNIQYYALVNMQCLVDIVETLGGIRLDVSRSESKAMNQLISSDAKSGDANARFATSQVQSGSQVLLNGKQVLAYTRIRKLDSDYARTTRQRTALTVIAKQLQKKGFLALVPILTSMLKYVETNLSTEQIMSLAKVGLSLDMGALTEFRIPADGTYQDGMFGGTWCIRPDFEENARQLYGFIYGE